MKRALVSKCLGVSGLRLMLSAMVPWSGVLVLNYHRIGDGRKSIFDRGLWSADEEAFADQLRICKSHLDMITPAELPAALASGRGRYGLITFDDGYRDNYETVFPILKEAHVPATFFIATGYIDEPRVPWWDEIAWIVRTSRCHGLELPQWLSSPLVFDEPDRERAVRALLQVYKRMQAESTGQYLDAIAEEAGTGRCPVVAGKTLWMDWDMLREMKAAGMVVGGHTVSHAVLSRLSEEQQREEVRGCAGRLAAELNAPMRYFSYPVGGLQAFDAHTRACLKEAGVHYAFSYYGGFRRLNDWDDYDVRRVPVETHHTSDWFRSIVMLPRWFA